MCLLHKSPTHTHNTCIPLGDHIWLRETSDSPPALLLRTYSARTAPPLPSGIAQMKAADLLATLKAFSVDGSVLYVMDANLTPIILIISAAIGTDTSEAFVWKRQMPLYTSTVF